MDLVHSAPAGIRTERGAPNLVLIRGRDASTAGLRFRREIDLALSVVPDLAATSRLGLLCARLEHALHQPGRDAGVPPAFRLGLLDAVPALRRFSSCRWTSLARIDEAVQATLLRAWSSRRAFAQGGALLPWLLTDLCRHPWAAGPPGAGRADASDLLGLAGFERLVEATFHEALWTLLDGHQREAMALVAGLRLQPRDAACILGLEQASVVRHLRRAETLLVEAWT